MWYEVLPGFGIICGCVVASGLAIKGIDYLFHGKVARLEFHFININDLMNYQS